MSVEDNTRPPFPQQLNQTKTAAETLPEPDQDAVAHSARVMSHIESRIAQSEQQRLSFADYMEIALNAPGLGYYSVGNQKFGAAGDFITAPEISDLYAAGVATQICQVLDQQGGDVWEFGAGSGRLAADLLASLQALNALPAHYYILETSMDLRQRQAQTLAARVPDLQTRVKWLDGFPADSFSGVIVANEVLDAMPAHRLRYHGDQYELAYVTIDQPTAQAVRPGSQLHLQYDSAPGSMQTMMQQRCGARSDGYTTELAPAREAWLEAVAQNLKSGVLLLVDYGYARHEYYHPQRSMGTLTCHFRHRVHSDAFFYPGLQDITTHVEFTAIAEAALDAGLTVAGFATQGQFLLSCGLDRIVQERQQSLASTISDGERLRVAELRLSQEMKKLILPSEMGESFKVLALTKRFDHNLVGFSQFDLRHKL